MDSNKSIKLICICSIDAVSNLDLDLIANGYGFTSVYATGEDTTLDLTGKITVNDTNDGSHISDFTGAGTQIFASNYASVNVNDMDISLPAFCMMHLSPMSIPKFP